MDFSKLDSLMSTLRSLADVPSQAATEASKGITAELQNEYASGADPYGKPWAPLKPSTLKRGRKPPPLTDTGALKSGTVAKPLPGAGISVVVGEPYGGFHQFGTNRMAARPILPNKGMPAKWNAIITIAVNNAMARKFK